MLKLIYICIIFSCLTISSIYADTLGQVLSKELKVVETNASLIDTQNIYDELEATGVTTLDEARILNKAGQYIGRVNSLVYKITNLYTKVIHSKELLAIAKEQVRGYEELYSEVNFSFELGLLSYDEKELYKSLLTSSYKNLQSEQNNLEESTHQYKNFLGNFPSVENINTSEFDRLLSIEMEDVVINIIEYNPSLFAYRYNINNIAAIKNVFTKLETLSKDRILLSNINAQRDLNEEVSDSIEVSWNTYKRLENELLNLVYYSRYYDQKLALYKEEYSLGEKSLLDVRLVEIDILNSRMDIAKMKYKVVFEQCRLLDVMGRLAPTVSEKTDAITSSKILLYINFKNSSTELPIDVQEELMSISEHLMNNSNVRANITGHTSKTKFSKEQSNINLSQARANRIKDELVNVYGINKKRLNAYAKGHSEPIADNETREGRMKNRRIEIELFE